MTAGPGAPTFVLLAGDVAHHPASLRPSPAVPLPEALRGALPPMLKNVGAPAYDRPFLDAAPAGCSVHHDLADTSRTLARVQQFDAHADVLVVLAHDSSLGGVVDIFPRELGAWKAKGWKERMFWAFLGSENPGNRWQSKGAGGQ